MADFGEILRTVGDFGLFQKLILFGLCFPNLILPFHLASLIFIQSDPECHCNTDWILRAGSNLSREEQLNLTVPREEDGAFSRCLMFTPVDWDIDTIREHGLNQTTECQNGWVYNKIMYEATIVTDFDLVCGKANVVGLAQTVFMAGILLGSLLFGPFAESFGRQRATQIPMVIMLIFTVTTGLSPNFYLYLASQFLVGIAYGGFRINGIVLATEWVGVTRRSYASCLSQTFGGVGQCILAGMIFFIRDWRLAQFVMAAPIAVVAVYIWFIPESARWLLDQGKSEEAKKLILRIAEEKVVQKGGVLILIRSPVLRKYFLTITLGWFSLNLSYYCLSFNVGNFGLDIFLTQLMFGLTEIPGHILCIFILEYLGRKISLMSTLLTGLGSIAIRIAGMLSPMLNILATYHWSIPTIVFSSLSLAGGALVVLLPETRRTELPDSTDEAEGKRNVTTTTKKKAKGCKVDVCDCEKSTKL
ncbi:unnamed protein product [Coregonus sp. 'balchen']|nr:unnamed protein product [Coregonus sp. 'balchen']